MTSPTPPADLLAAATAFAEQFSDYGTVDGAEGACAPAVEDFRSIYPTAVVRHVLGCRLSFPERSDFYADYPDPDPDLYHVVCQAGDWYIDPTRRQFDPDAPFPLLQPAAEFQRDWILIAEDWETLDAEITVAICERQATEKWVRDANCNPPEAEVQAELAHQKAELAKAIEKRTKARKRLLQGA